MYAKIFEQIYEGTLVSQGPWQALVTFQQLLILADQEGIVDMTLDAIHRRTTIPVEILETGIEALMAPDPYSRTPDEEGRRIVLLSDHRPWGWRIVNYTKFRQLQREMDRRDYHRQYYHNVRKLNSTVSTHSTQPQPIQPIAEAYTKANPLEALSGKSKKYRSEATQILEYLNEIAERNFQPVASNINPIIARLKEGATVVQAYDVIADRCDAWKTDAKMFEFIRPKTLFNATNFNNYLGNLKPREAQNG